MKWKRPDGTLIETNDKEATIAQAKAHGWTPVKGSKKVKLYKRLSGELIEGEPPPPDGKVIIESESFREEDAPGKIKEGWFATEEEAAIAPPDKPKKDEK